MTAKHTPGPWQVRDLGLFEWHRSPFNPWRRLLIHTPKPEGSGPTVLFAKSICELADPSTDTDMQSANARLIAAAPDLLAACRAALSLIESEHCCAISGEPEPEYAEDVERLRAAIAKATKEQP